MGGPQGGLSPPKRMATGSSELTRLPLMFQSVLTEETHLEIDGVIRTVFVSKYCKAQRVNVCTRADLRDPPGPEGSRWP